MIEIKYGWEFIFFILQYLGNWSRGLHSKFSKVFEILQILILTNRHCFNYWKRSDIQIQYIWILHDYLYEKRTLKINFLKYYWLWPNWSKTFQKDQRNWDTPENDFFFTIYYKYANELLPVLCNSLRNIDPDMENQHLNQVHAMQSAVGNKHVFATNVLLWNHDHHSQMKTLGKKQGVAPGMLCYRYCSLGQFVQLLGTQEIELV